MANAITFKILEDIAKDLSGSEITFPTFLDITFQVHTALKDPNLSVEQLAKLVGAEPLMSAKIIRMANSAALNPSGREIADVKSAIIRVGMEAVRTWKVMSRKVGKVISEPDKSLAISSRILKVIGLLMAGSRC